jgi:hypothetical protein
MMAFASGSELSPLVVIIVDAPVANFTHALEPRSLAMGIPIAVCSVLYSVVFYLLGVLILRTKMRLRPSTKE